MPGATMDLGYQCTVNSLLIGMGERTTCPVLTDDELREMDEARRAGVSAQDFAARIARRSEQARAIASDCGDCGALAGQPCRLKDVSDLAGGRKPYHFTRALRRRTHQLQRKSA